jgi:ATP-dependent Lon protease
VAMVTALTSLFTERTTRPWVAMTGEITLTGFVLRVGGVKEKVLAARRSGISEVILPAQSRDDVFEEIPEELRRGLTFHFVDTIAEVLDLALEPSEFGEHVAPPTHHGHHPSAPL